jgi:hypothetical protein
MMNPFGSFGSPGFPGGTFGSPNIPGSPVRYPNSPVPGDFNRNYVPDIVEYQRWLEQQKLKYYWDQQRKKLTTPLVGSLSPIYKRQTAVNGSSNRGWSDSWRKPVLNQHRLDLSKCLICKGRGKTLNGLTCFFCKGTGLAQKR